MSANARFVALCSTFSISSPVAPLIDFLDGLSKDLAQNQELRTAVGNAEPAIWSHLRWLWTETASAHRLADAEDAHDVRALCLSLSRFTRNLSAAVPSNQDRAFENEPAIRTLLHHYTSYYVLEDKKSLPVTRMLIQTLSNIVTANEQLTERIWTQYMSLPVEDQILIRLLGVTDDSTVLSTLVFVLNCVHLKAEQLCVSDVLPHMDQLVYLSELLARSPNGPRLSISLLDQTAVHFDKEPSTDGGRAFEIGYAIVSCLIEEGLVPQLYQNIAVDQEVVSPHQTTLLKILDSYLHSARPSGPTTAHHQALCDLCIACFFTLSVYAQQSMRRALGIDVDGTSSADRKAPASAVPTQNCTDIPAAEPTTSDHDGGPATSLQELDLLLPKVGEALVLATQCLISLTLQSGDSGENIEVVPRRTEDSLRTTDGTRRESIKGYVGIALSPNGNRFVEVLIETLRLFDLFLPRIQFGKAASPPVIAGGGNHATRAQSSSAPPSAVNDGTRDENVSSAKTLPVDPRGFSYLKRDLVRLLGILSYRSKQIQDQTRLCGGIPVVLNMCVVDERNPYLREHAIFALRNLLDGNLENQALVNEIQPIREWDMEGQLRRRPRV